MNERNIYLYARRSSISANKQKWSNSLSEFSLLGGQTRTKLNSIQFQFEKNLDSITYSFNLLLKQAQSPPSLLLLLLLYYHFKWKDRFSRKANTLHSKWIKQTSESVFRIDIMKKERERKVNVDHSWKTRMERTMS